MEVLRQKTILAADDDADILELLRDALTHEGYAVVTASDGKQAWQKIRKDNPDIIILDLMMPEMDGFTVLKKLRASPPGDKWQPVIILSALGDLKHMRKGFFLEADHYITKPWDMKDILKGIHLMEKLILQRKDKADIDIETAKNI